MSVFLDVLPLIPGSVGALGMNQQRMHTCTMYTLFGPRRNTRMCEICDRCFRQGGASRKHYLVVLCSFAGSVAS